MQLLPTLLDGDDVLSAEITAAERRQRSLDPRIDSGRASIDEMMAYSQLMKDLAELHGRREELRFTIDQSQDSAGQPAAECGLDAAPSSRPRSAPARQ